MNNLISDDGVKLILDYEIGGGKSYYDKFLSKPTVPAWKTTQSGITIGCGWDCGYNDKDSLYQEWVDYLPENFLQELSLVLGFKGKEAYENLNKVKDVIVEYEIAISQFKQYTIPRYYNLAKKSFINLDDTPQCVKDVILSLVFNRGNSLKVDKNNTRKEMIIIKDDIDSKNYKDIANQLILMKRLWKNVKGLQNRRDAEAKYLLDRL